MEEGLFWEEVPSLELPEHVGQPVVDGPDEVLELRRELHRVRE